MPKTRYQIASETLSAALPALDQKIESAYEALIARLIKAEADVERIKLERSKEEFRGIETATERMERDITRLDKDISNLQPSGWTKAWEGFVNTFRWLTGYGELETTRIRREAIEDKTERLNLYQALLPSLQNMVDLAQERFDTEVKLRTTIEKQNNLPEIHAKLRGELAQYTTSFTTTNMTAAFKRALTREKLSETQKEANESLKQVAKALDKLLENPTDANYASAKTTIQANMNYTDATHAADFITLLDKIDDAYEVLPDDLPPNYGMSSN